MVGQVPVPASDERLCRLPGSAVQPPRRKPRKTQENLAKPKKPWNLNGEWGNPKTRENLEKPKPKTQTKPKRLNRIEVGLPIQPAGDPRAASQIGNSLGSCGNSLDQ